MLLTKDFKPTQRDSNELLLFLYLQYITFILYVQFLPDNEVRERQNVEKFLTFLRKVLTQFFIAIWSQRDKIQLQRISLTVNKKLMYFGQITTFLP